MRLFTAFSLPPDVSAHVAAFTARLRHTGAPRFVTPDHLHITTRFIDDVADVDAVTAALSQIPRRGPVELCVRGIGYLPDPRRPRVFFAHVEDTPTLRAHAADIDQQLALSCGIGPGARAFRPHLTLARVRTPAEFRMLRHDLAAHDVDADMTFGRWLATTFSLWRSEPGDGKHVHTLQATLPLLPTTAVPTSFFNEPS